jgi:hypothetical protein
MIQTAPFTGERVAKRALFLAYQHSRLLGLGVLQKRDNASEEDVWQACVGAHDYRGSQFKKAPPGQAHADYVFGRHMKVDFRWTDSTVEAHAQNDDQAWCANYTSTDALLQAAIASLKTEV